MIRYKLHLSRREYDHLRVTSFDKMIFSFRKELKGKASIVRELHVYGSAVPVGGRHPKKFQHHVRFPFFVLNRDY